MIARQLIAVNGRGHIAIAEGEKIHVGFGAGDGRARRRGARRARLLRATAKPSVGFEVLQLNFNSADETQLLVSGLKECVALTLGERGELVSRISIDLMLDTLGLGLPVHILRTAWLPGSVSRCYVLTNQFIKVYDLAKDKICPQYYYQVLEDAIKDVAFAPTGADGTLTPRAHGLGCPLSQPLVAESGGGPPHSATRSPSCPSSAAASAPPSTSRRRPASLCLVRRCKCFGPFGGAATEVVGGFAARRAHRRHGLLVRRRRRPRRPRRRGAVGGVGGVDDAVPALEDVAGQRGLTPRVARRCCRWSWRVTPTAPAAAPPAAKAEGPAPPRPSRALAKAAAAAAARRRTSVGARRGRRPPRPPGRRGGAFGGGDARGSARRALREAARGGQVPRRLLRALDARDAGVGHLVLGRRAADHQPGRDQAAAIGHLRRVRFGDVEGVVDALSQQPEVSSSWSACACSPAPPTPSTSATVSVFGCGSRREGAAGGTTCR